MIHKITDLMIDKLIRLMSTKNAIHVPPSSNHQSMSEQAAVATQESTKQRRPCSRPIGQPKTLTKTEPVQIFAMVNTVITESSLAQDTSNQGATSIL